MDIDKIKTRFSGAGFIVSEMPAVLANIDPALVTELDVREDLRNGREPFSRIMEAQRRVAPNGALRLRAIFEPVPLYAALGKSGFSHWTRRLADDDWEVWFYRGTASTSAPATEQPDAARAELPPDGDVVTLDVRGLEPPEPMLRTLEALERLRPGGTLIQINSRIPHILLPVLEERGFEYSLVSEEAGVVTGRIRRKETENLGA